MKMDEIFKLYGNEPDKKQIIHQLGANIFQDIEMSSSFVNCGRDITYPTDIVNLHSHGFYEITLFKSGRLRYLVDDKRYQIEKGDILIVPPGFTHCPLELHTLTEPYERIINCVSKGFISYFISHWHSENDYKSIFARPTLFKTTGTPYETLCRYLENNAMESSLSSPYADAFLAGNTLCFLSKLMEAHDTDFAPARRLRKELIDSILTYTEQNYAGKITIQDITDEFHIGKTVLIRLFKENLNCTFHHHLTLVRLNAAKNMFSNDLSLEAIAEAVGFNDYSSFYRAFKKEFGISPKDYYVLMHYSP